MTMPVRSAAATPGARSPRSRRQAERPAIRKATVSAEATSMCARRYGMEGLRMIAIQSVACATPSRISKPAGVCIQEFSTRIQKALIVVPTATSTVAPVCTQPGTRRKPKSMMPRKVASRKKAVSTS
jgi:hypothetical protein